MQLNELRSKIDQLDEQLLQLLNKRAALAKQIGSVKKMQELAVHHPDRESRVIQNLVNQNQGPLSTEQVVLIFTQIIKSCRDIQNSRG